jgi:hypothetical protein
MKILSASNDRYVSLASTFFSKALFAASFRTSPGAARLVPDEKGRARKGSPALGRATGPLRKRAALPAPRAAAIRSSVDLPLDCDATMMRR